MKSNIIKKENHDALIKANKAMSPKERLVAFYHHSQLMNELARAGQKARKKPQKISRAPSSHHS